MVSRAVLILCVTFFLLSFAFPLVTKFGCLSPRKLFAAPSLAYQLLSSPFIHFSIMHIFFNMSTLLSLGPWFERRVGSMAFAALALLPGPVFIASLHLLISLPFHLYQQRWDAGRGAPESITSLLGDPMRSCTAGYSAVLFFLITVKVYAPDAKRSRKLFGISMPAKLYPWVLMAFIQFVFPRVSFYGHLSGLAAGLFYCRFIERQLMPQIQPTFAFLEQKLCPQSIYHSDQWISSHSLTSIPTKQTRTKKKVPAAASPSSSSSSTFQAFSGSGNVLGGK